MDRDELNRKNEELKKLSKRMLFAIIALFVSVPLLSLLIAAVLFAVAPDINDDMCGVIRAIIYILDLFVFALILARIGRKQRLVKQRMEKEYKGEQLLSEIQIEFPSAQFYSDASINKDEFNETGFYSNNKYQSSGEYVIESQGKRIILTTFGIEASYGDGYTTARKGYLLKTKLPREYDFRLLIKNRDLITHDLIHQQRIKELKATDMETGYEDFDKRYSIKTSSVENAKNIITNGLINLLTMSEKNSEMSLKIENREVYAVNLNTNYETAIKKDGFIDGYKCEISIVNSNLYVEFVPLGGIPEVGTIGVSLEQVMQENKKAIIQAVKLTENIFNAIKNNDYFEATGTAAYHV